MTTGQDQPVPFYCPRCGGPMYKPTGSSFYWHATNDHPPCSITNIIEIPKSTLASAPSPDTPPEEQQKRRKR